MKLVTIGRPRRPDRRATFSSSPKRRTSTPAISTGERAWRRQARMSATQASSASPSTGGSGARVTGAQGCATMSRGISMYTGCEWRRQLASTREMSAGARAASSRRTWSQVISRNIWNCESSVLAWWCKSSPECDSPLPGPPESTTTGDFSAYAAATALTMFKAPAP